MAENTDTDEEKLDETEQEEAGEEKPKSKKKLFIIGGALALLILLGGGGAAYFFLFAPGSDQEELIEQAEPVFFYDMETITVNLATVGDEPQKFLKISVSLEVEQEKMMEIIAPRMVRVQDAFQVYLRELRPSDLEGSAGIYRLKQELLKRVNQAVYPAKVNNILFKEILVQ